MLLRWCLLVWSSNWSSRCWLSRNVFISFFIAAFSVNSIVAIRGVFRRSNVSQETRNTVDTVGTQWPPAPHNFDGVIGLFWTNYLLLRIFAIQHAINPSVKRAHDCMARFYTRSMVWPDETAVRDWQTVRKAQWTVSFHSRSLLAYRKVVTIACVLVSFHCICTKIVFYFWPIIFSSLDAGSFIEIGDISSVEMIYCHSTLLAADCYAAPLIGGGIKRWCCLTSVCISVWRLSVAYIGPKSRT